MLVDSTVWIDLLRGTYSPPVTVLRGLLQDGDAAVAPVIVQEVLQGAASADAFAELEARFLRLPLLEARAGAATHAGAAALYARCRWQGVTPRSPHDCLIAQIAHSQCCPAARATGEVDVACMDVGQGREQDA